MTSQASKEQYVQQMDEILHGVDVNKAKVKKKLDEEKQRRDMLMAEKLELVELGRQYVVAYKQAGLEANINESLLTQLKNTTSTLPQV